MRFFLGILVVAALAILAWSVAVHVSTYLGIPQDFYSPSNSWLNFLAFALPFASCWSIVWLAFVASRVHRPDVGDRVLRCTPRAMLGLCGALTLYSMVGFGVLEWLASSGVPAERDGQFILHSHGRLVRVLTPEEYGLQQAYVVRRATSSHMVFSCASLTILVGLLRVSRCPATSSTAPSQSTTS